MKIYRQLLALSVFATVGTTAFAPIKTSKVSSVLKSELAPSSGAPSAPSSGDFEIFPAGTFTQMETLPGGGTVRTYKIPLWADRCQYYLQTNGRPLKATVELWIGPIRTVHTLRIDSEDGKETPYQALLSFKKVAPTLRIITSDIAELPVQASVFVPPPDRAKELAANTEKVFGTSTPEQKQFVQGGTVYTEKGGGGSVRTWNIPAEVDCVQLVGWTRDAGKKSFKCKVEVSQGPNNPKQDFFIQCGGGTQPYHSVIQTPGPGWIIRITNQKYIEDGLVQFAVLPYAYPLVKPTETKQWWQ
jgi:hypothetical protein